MLLSTESYFTNDIRISAVSLKFADLVILI